MNKRNFKNRHKECAICGEPKYELLDVHRVVEGQEYSNGNCLTLCCRCHRSHHSGLIKIKDKRYSTIGTVLVYVDEKGQEITKLIY